jgi:hypothetical protein
MVATMVYCVGLLYGLPFRKPIQECLAMASVSASFEMEQYGLCRFSDDMIPVREINMEQVFRNIITLDNHYSKTKNHIGR